MFSTANKILGFTMMNWTQQFRDFFTSRKEQLAEILDAGGCREGWLQGEIYLHFRKTNLQTNATGKKYDLFCDAPPMVGEIKICGGDYQPKMKGLIISDIQKLRKSPAEYQRFMILVVDTRKLDTPLGRWLISPGFAQENAERLKGNGFEVLIWEIKAQP
jgi:hypothetical protein